MHRLHVFPAILVSPKSLNILSNCTLRKHTIPTHSGSKLENTICSINETALKCFKCLLDKAFETNGYRILYKHRQCVESKLINSHKVNLFQLTCA